MKSLLLLLLSALVCGCGQAWLPSAHHSPSPTPSARPLPAVSALARLEPKGELREVAPPVGRGNEPVARWLISEGDRVKQGQLLAVLDSESLLQAQVSSAKARVKRAEAAFAQVAAGPKRGTISRQNSEIQRLQRERKLGLAEQDVAIRRALENEEKAQKEFERYRNLFQQGATPESTLDQREREYRSLRLQREELEKARRRLDLTLSSSLHSAHGEMERIQEVRPTDLNYAQAEIDIARSEVSRLEAELQKAKLFSPIDGTVLEILTQAGELPKDGVLVEIGRTEQMVAIAEVHQQDISRVALGQNAVVSSPALNKPVRGQVRRIGRQVQRQRIFSNIPGENFDQRVVEVELELDMTGTPELQTLSNLQAEAIIEVETR